MQGTFNDHLMKSSTASVIAKKRISYKTTDKKITSYKGKKS